MQRKLANNPHWKKVVEYYHSQKTADVLRQRRTLELIQTMQADKKADQERSTKPSQMSSFERTKSAFLHNLSRKNKAYLTLCGMNVKSSPLETSILSHSSSSIVKALPSNAAIFAPFAMSMCVASSTGFIPSLLPLCGGAIAAVSFRAAAASHSLAGLAIDYSKSDRQQVTDTQADSTQEDSGYSFSASELTIIKAAGILGGLGSLAIAGVPWYGLGILPLTLVLPQITKQAPYLISTVGAPLGLMTCPNLSQLGWGEMLPVQALLWAGTAISRKIFHERNGNVILAGFGASCIWLGGLSLGGLHRSFVILGFPASSGLIAQTFTNRYVKRNNLSADYAGTAEDLKLREAIVCLLFVGAFMTSRAYSGRNGLVVREATVVGGLNEEEAVAL